MIDVKKITQQIADENYAAEQLKIIEAAEAEAKRRQALAASPVAQKVLEVLDYLSNLPESRLAYSVADPRNPLQTKIVLHPKNSDYNHSLYAVSSSAFFIFNEDHKIGFGKGRNLQTVVHDGHNFIPDGSTNLRAVLSLIKDIVAHANDHQLVCLPKPQDIPGLSIAETLSLSGAEIAARELIRISNAKEAQRQQQAREEAEFRKAAEVNPVIQTLQKNFEDLVRLSDGKVAIVQTYGANYLEVQCSTPARRVILGKFIFIASGKILGPFDTIYAGQTININNAAPTAAQKLANDVAVGVVMNTLLEGALANGLLKLPEPQDGIPPGLSYVEERLQQMSNATVAKQREKETYRLRQAELQKALAGNPVVRGIRKTLEQIMETTEDASFHYKHTYVPGKSFEDMHYEIKLVKGHRKFPGEAIGTIRFDRDGTVQCGRRVVKAGEAFHPPYKGERTPEIVAENDAAVDAITTTAIMLIARNGGLPLPKPSAALVATIGAKPTVQSDGLENAGVS